MNMVDEVDEVELDVDCDPQIGDKKENEPNVTPISMDAKQDTSKIEQHFENFIRTSNYSNFRNDDIMKGIYR